MLVVLALAVWWWLSPAMPWVAWRALATADSYEVLSLNPRDMESAGAKPTFYGNTILGSVEITDPNVRARLNRAFDIGVREKGSPAACLTRTHRR